MDTHVITVHHQDLKTHIGTQEVPVKHIWFELHPPKSSYKALFHGTQLGEILTKMLGVTQKGSSTLNVNVVQEIRIPLYHMFLSRILFRMCSKPRPRLPIQVDGTGHW
jgi:hypothetical protein